MKLRVLVLLAPLLPWLSCVMAASQEVAAPIKAQMRPLPTGGARFTGKVNSVSGLTFLLTLRNGQSLMVDRSEALKNHLAVIANPGTFVMVEGALSGAGVLKAAVVTRAKANELNWMPDAY